MALDSQKYRAALAHLGNEQPIFAEPPATFRAWLAEKQLPADVVEFLIGTAVADNVPFPDGTGGIWPPENITGLNDQESSFLASGLFAVGNAVNGDFIAIDLRDDRRPAGFIGHDELAGNCEDAEHLMDNPRAIFIPVADSLDELLVGMSGALWEFLGSNPPEESRYPCDYCDAIAWRERG